MVLQVSVTCFPNSRNDSPATWRLPRLLSDIQIHARDLKRIKQKLNKLLAEHTGQPLEVVERDTDRDNFHVC
ncbi:ATP-dependent Clp protease proteolytic subunit [Vibrio lentus]|nr:ATP-dependent Clp protease proteolytic subunit [Vibrio lentus]